MCTWIVHRLIAHAFSSIWLLHILSTRGQSNVTDSIIFFAGFSCGVMCVVHEQKSRTSFSFFSCGLLKFFRTPRLACTCGEMLAGVPWGCLCSSDASQSILFSHAGKLESRMRRVGRFRDGWKRINKNKVTRKHNCRFWQSNIYWLFIFSPWNSFQQPKYVGNRARTFIELNNHLVHRDNNPFAAWGVNIDRIPCKLFSPVVLLHLSL